MKNISFKNKHIMISGGSSGIGKATARQFVTQGATVSIIARNPQKLAAAKLELEALKISNTQKIITCSADVSNQPEIEKAIKEIIEENGPPFCLINSAGIARPDYFQNLSLNVFEETMAINYFGTLYAIKATLPSMIAKREGTILIVSSGAGLIGIYGYSSYSPSKFALRGLAESLRGELKLFGINVSIIYPPDTDTNQLEQENKTKPKETKLINGTARTLSADEVARSIINGISNNKFEIAPGLEMKLLLILHSLISPFLNKYFDFLVAKAASK